MEKSSSQNIQDAFLNTLRREKAVVTIHLLHGSTLSGRLKSFDKFSVLLDATGQDFLIFKHAIATVTTTQRFSRPAHEGGERDQRDQRSGEQQPPRSSSAAPPQFNRRPNE